MTLFNFDPADAAPPGGVLFCPNNQRTGGTILQPLTGKPNPTEAIRLLGEFTRGRFDIWMLAGQHNAGNRAILLSHLTGNRQPQSKAGINALRDAFYSQLQIVGESIAEREDHFRFVCSETVAALNFHAQQAEPRIRIVPSSEIDAHPTKSLLARDYVKKSPRGER